MRRTVDGEALIALAISAHYVARVARTTFRIGSKVKYTFAKNPNMMEYMNCRLVEPDVNDINECVVRSSEPENQAVKENEGRTRSK
jgi:hypothetical protein